MGKSKVFFIKNITPNNVVKIYKQLNIELKGKVALKLHSGEVGNQNFLHPDFYNDIVNYLNATVVECNTAYGGSRNNTQLHKQTLIKHGWSELYDVDLLNENDDDMILNVKNGKILQRNYVGGHLKNYDSLLVVSHFKGHPMGGYGGALKQLSIGIASSRGKAYIHSAARTLDQNDLWDNLPPQNDFLCAMADAASSVCDYFKDNMAFINVMKNMSVDCDCCAVAEDPCMKDIGILASLNPLALDKACIDLVFNSTDPGKDKLIERITSRNGLLTLKAFKEITKYSDEYELVELD